LQYRDLGESGMRVSEVSLGTWAFRSELTDVEQEVNGLRTSNRKPKADSARIRRITTRGRH
jgi:aryl-alcohol dehydrogenase-like predicted oxidoreductase